MQMKSAPCTDITRGAFQCGWRDSNPHALWAGDFKSPVSAIPPQPHWRQYTILMKNASSNSVLFRYPMVYFSECLLFADRLMRCAEPF